MKHLIQFAFLLFVISSLNCSGTAWKDYKEGMEKMNRKQYAEAIEQFNSAIDKNPRFGAAYLARAKAKLILWDSIPTGNDYKSAEKDFDKALKFNPSLTETALIGKSTIRINLHDYAAAVGYLNIAEEIHPENKQIYYLRADAKKQLQDSPGVIKDYTNLIALDSSNAEAFLLRAEHYLLMNDKTSACKDLEIAKKLNPSAEIAGRIEKEMDSNCGKK